MNKYINISLILLIFSLTNIYTYKVHIKSFKLTNIIKYAHNVEIEINKEKTIKSFVLDVMRPYAMKLHTREQSPREGQQPTPRSSNPNYQPSRLEFLRFLVDSLAVYRTLDEIVKEEPSLKSLVNTGLERSEALVKDIEWITKTFDTSISTPPEVGSYGLEYSKFLKALVKESVPRFVCHYYNQYFAHTAGGLMIGKRLTDLLLEGNTLNFYKWTDRDGNIVTTKEGVKDLLEATRIKIDELASTWTEEEQQACLDETIKCFQYGGSLMSYMKPK